MILPILKHPNPKLSKKSLNVLTFDNALQTLIDNMFETMYDAKGIGLAAPQIGYNINLFVTHIDSPLVFINPIVECAGNIIDSYEGCLSVDMFTGNVNRFDTISITAKNRFNKEFKLHNVFGLLALCIQHEMDHLNGIVILDKI